MRHPVCVDAGGGVALLYASKSLDAVKGKLENFDQTVGVQILQTALRVPLKTIADNAGRHPAQRMPPWCSPLLLFRPSVQHEIFPACLRFV